MAVLGAVVEPLVGPMIKAGHRFALVLAGYMDFPKTKAVLVDRAREPLSRQSVRFQSGPQEVTMPGSLHNHHRLCRDLPIARVNVAMANEHIL